MSSYFALQQFIVSGIGGSFIHDGSTYLNEDIVELPHRAIINYTLLANGVYYDHDGDERSKLVAEPVTVSANYVGSDLFDAMSKVESWSALEGYKGTLTAVRVSDASTTYSCTARLETKQITHPFKAPPNTLSVPCTIRLTLTFRPTTNWELDA